MKVDYRKFPGLLPLGCLLLAACATELQPDPWLSGQPEPGEEVGASEEPEGLHGRGRQRPRFNACAIEELYFDGACRDLAFFQDLSEETVTTVYGTRVRSESPSVVMAESVAENESRLIALSGERRRYASLELDGDWERGQYPVTAASQSFVWVTEETIITRTEFLVRDSRDRMTLVQWLDRERIGSTIHECDAAGCETQTAEGGLSPADRCDHEANLGAIGAYRACMATFQDSLWAIALPALAGIALTTPTGPFGPLAIAAIGISAAATHYATTTNTCERERDFEAQLMRRFCYEELARAQRSPPGYLTPEGRDESSQREGSGASGSACGEGLRREICERGAGCAAGNGDGSSDDPEPIEVDCDFEDMECWGEITVSDPDGCVAYYCCVR